LACLNGSEIDPCKLPKEETCFIFLETLYKDIVSKMIIWLEEDKVRRGLYYKLLQLYRNYVKETEIDPRIYPKIYYYVARNVKDENVRKELIDTLLNGMQGNLSVRSVIGNLDVILYLVLMKTRGGG